MFMILNKVFKFVIKPFICVSLAMSLLGGPAICYSQEIDLNLPAPTKIKPISKTFNPATIRAITINQNDPFLFDFIIDRGDSNLDPEAFEAETQKLVKYFLAALTIPEADLWVNLSPYEQDAMVSPVLGVTELGKDLLIKDYYLKQVAAAMTNPNTPTGKKFWELAYAKSRELYGNTNVPINTFSKVWIVPDRATVLEKDGSAFVADSHLKVFLDQDYTAVKHNLDNKEIGTDKLGDRKTKDINNFSAQIMRDVVLPEIEKEVNIGENFAAVRQIYSAAILATWYKARLKESLLGQLYADKNKVAGVNADDMDAGEKIFEKYTAALKTGAYNMIKQDYDLSTQKIVQRKYFSGGFDGTRLASSTAVIAMTGGATRLPPASSQSVQNFISGTRSASSGLNFGYTNVTVRVGNPSDAVSQDVENRLSGRNSPGGTILRAAGNSDERLRDLGVSFGGTASNNSASLTTQFDNFPTIDLSAIESLVRFSDAEVASLAERIGSALPPMQKLREEIKAAMRKVKPAEYPEVYRSFVPPVRKALSPFARQSLAQVSDPDWQSIKSLELMAETSVDEFDTATRSFSPGQKSDLFYVREKVRTLTPGQTVMNLIADNDPRLNRVLASPTLRVFANRPAKVVVTQAERQAVAVIFASKPDVNTRVALTGMGYNPEEVAYMMSAQGRKDLVSTVEQNADRFLSLAKIDPTTIRVLQNVLNPYGNGTRTKEQYRAESKDLYDALVKQGLNPESINQVVEIRTELESAAIDTQHITSNDVVRAVWTAGFSQPVESFVETLRDKPVLTSTLVGLKMSKEGNNRVVTVDESRMASDFMNQQISAAQRLVGLDDQTLNSIVLANPQLGLTTVEQEAIRSDVALARALRALNPQAKIFSGRNGTAIAKAVTNPDFVKLVNKVRASSVVNAPFAADYLARSNANASSSSASLFGKTLESLRGNNKDAVAERLSQVVKKGTPDSAVEHLARALVTLANNTERLPTLLAITSTAQARREITAVLVASGVSAEVAEEAAALYNQQVGGIDLSADKMGLQIKRDGKGVPLPISAQDIKNIQIDGLVPVILDVQPATPASMPFLLNFTNGTQSK